MPVPNDESVPLRVVAKYVGRCYECNEAIDPGDTVIFDPQERRTYCETCGEEMLPE